MKPSRRVNNLLKCRGPGVWFSTMKRKLLASPNVVFQHDFGKPLHFWHRINKFFSYLNTFCTFFEPGRQNVWSLFLLRHYLCMYVCMWLGMCVCMYVRAGIENSCLFLHWIILTRLESQISVKWNFKIQNDDQLEMTISIKWQSAQNDNQHRKTKHRMTISTERQLAQKDNWHRMTIGTEWQSAQKDNRHRMTIGT